MVSTINISIFIRRPYNIHIILEKRHIKFIHSALNGNEICKQILCVKLRCKSHRLQKIIDKYLGNVKFSDCDWFANIAYIMGKN